MFPFANLARFFILAISAPSRCRHVHRTFSILVTGTRSQPPQTQQTRSVLAAPSSLFGRSEDGADSIFRRMQTVNEATADSSRKCHASQQRLATQTARRHSIAMPCCVPEPPSATQSPLSRMSRFRFVDASYNPDCRRLPSSPYLGSSGAGRGGGGEWSPRRRKVISSTQLEKLLEVFEQVDSPDIDIREKLGAVSSSLDTLCRLASTSTILLTPRFTPVSRKST